MRQFKSDTELVERLVMVSNNRPKLIKSSTYAAPAAPEITVRSWKMNEFKYYDVPSPFPTLARGLFTRWISDGDKEGKEGSGNGEYRIVARGYDKFFNIGEVPWTTWAALEEHTVAPYHLTVKSNGCIIFIAALTPGKLLVTSKHSLGPIEGVKVSHAQMGERWLHEHLSAKNKTVEEFAKILWDNKWTAVAELCDDSFEEHVLPYSVDKTGLHLHGLNDSTGFFATRSPQEVADFAKEWGFIQTAWHTVNSVKEVKEFTDEIGKDGKWDGEPVEGFVVRCQISNRPDRDARSSPPYPPGSSFFFKVKFDEPYMTYRDWREITKVLLSGKATLDGTKIPKSKLRRPESHLYLKWVREEIRNNKQAFEGFNKGHGIVATRERFLKWMESQKGGDGGLSPHLLAASTGKSDGNQAEKLFGKTIIVPIAIPGCGKTSIAVALQHLFGFGHTQSDDVKGKRPAAIFVKNVISELKTHDVVFADKNNHLTQHRRELRDAVKSWEPPVRFLALNWIADKPPAMVHRICADRVVNRGENHQTLRADVVTKNHEEVIWMFINQMQELAEDEVDEVVEMDVEEDLEQGLDRAVDACVRFLGLQKPSAEAVGQALAKARGYTAKSKAEEPKSKKKGAAPRYFGFLPEVDIESVVNDRLSQGDVPKSLHNLWDLLRKQKRVANRPHITLVHNKNLPKEQEFWDECSKAFLSASPLEFEFRLGNIISDGRLIAVTIDDVKPRTSADRDTNSKAQAFIDRMEEALKQRLHITVGTKPPVNPVEAGPLVLAWKRGQADKTVISLPLEDVVATGQIKGLHS